MLACVAKSPIIQNVFGRASSRMRRMSRFSASTITSGSDTFKFSDYDCIGFDLDGTLCSYNISNKVKLCYDILSRFLVEKRQYDSSLLYLPLEQDISYFQKGLMLDLVNGNTVKLNSEGLINKACHGLTQLNEQEIKGFYPNLEWQSASNYMNKMLQGWNNPLSSKVRALLDYFDLAAVLCFGRCVQTVELKGHPTRKVSEIWPDILDGLILMFIREHFELHKGEYFPAMKKSPELYYRKTNPNVIKWLKELKKQNKTTFVVTGAHVDFASHTGNYCLGPNWQELFDVVIYYGRKPGFFVGNRPFLEVKNGKEMDIIDSKTLVLGKGLGYTQGNWEALRNQFKKSHGIEDPKCLYIGDNLLQDIYAPRSVSTCDTVSISEELAVECVSDGITHFDAKILESELWGSYFSDTVAGVKVPSFWCEIIQRHSKICIPRLDVVADLPLDHEFLTFSDDKLCNAGFYPCAPHSLD